MKYITKPVIIEAEQWFRNSHEGAFTDQSENLKKVKRVGENKFTIDTKQREVEVFDGDFIITLEDGESYPCNPKVFHNKYKPLTVAEEYYNDPIFNLLNCYEIDGSEIHEGMAHIDSGEAEKLTKEIRKLL